MAPTPTNNWLETNKQSLRETQGDSISLAKLQVDYRRMEQDDRVAQQRVPAVATHDLERRWPLALGDLGRTLRMPSRDILSGLRRCVECESRMKVAMVQRWLYYRSDDRVGAEC